MKSSQSSSARTADHDEIDLLDCLVAIWRYLWLILLLCVAAVAVVVLLSMREPLRYEAVVTVVPPLDSLQKGGGSSGLGTMVSPLLRQVIDTGSGGVAGMYQDILGSREVADAIIEEMHLMDVYRAQYRENARRLLRANTAIKTTDGGGVRITVTDCDPNRSAAIANAYVAELDRQNKRLSAGQATSKRVFLENRLKEVETKLSKIDGILSREAKTQEMLYEMLVQQYEVAKIEEAKSLPTLQILDKAVVPELPKARGIRKKGMLAGVVACMLGIFLAMLLDHVAEARRRRARIRRSTREAEDVSRVPEVRAD